MAAGADATLRFDVVVTDNGGTRTFNIIANAASNAGNRIGAAGKQADAASRHNKKLGDSSRLTVADLGNLGKAATKATSGLTEMFSTGAELTAKNPYVLLAAGAAAAAVANVALAAAAGAALTGLGAGFVALSLKSLSSSAKVTGAMEALSATAKGVMSDAAMQLEDDWVGFFSRLEDSVVHVGPAFDHIFDIIDRSDVLDDLNNGFDGLIDNAMPGLINAAEAAIPALESFAAMLPEIGASLGEFFDDLGDSGPGAVMAFQAVLGYALSTLELFGKAIKTVSGTIEMLAATADNLTGGGFSKFVGLTRESVGPIDASAEATGGLAGKHREVAEELERATFWTKSFVAAQGLLNAAHIDTVQAELASVEANARFGEAVKDSKGKLDGQTEAARKAQSAMLSGIEAAGRYSDAIKDETNSSDKGTAALYRMLDGLRAQLPAGSAAQRQFDVLSATFVKNRAAALASTTSVRGLNTEIAQLKAKRVDVVARTGSSSAEVAELDRRIRALHNRTLLVTVNTHYEPLLSGRLDFFGHPTKKKAMGGPVTAGRPYIVGEKRAELFVPSQNGTILPRVPTGGGGGNTYNINVNAAPGAPTAEIGRVTVAAIQEFERRSGTGWRA